MLTPSQFGALQSPPITRQAVHYAIKQERITPKPKKLRTFGRSQYEYRIDPKATIAPPKKPGPKGPRSKK